MPGTVPHTGNTAVKVTSKPPALLGLILWWGNNKQVDISDSTESYILYLYMYVYTYICKHTHTLTHKYQKYYKDKN